MASHVVSFRFSDREIELLKQHANAPDESTNAIAQRLLRELLGLSTESSTSVDSFESRVVAIAHQAVDKRIQERLQEEMATFLGELSA
jgi:hypothetical protein